MMGPTERMSQAWAHRSNHIRIDLTLIVVLENVFTRNTSGTAGEKWECKASGHWHTYKADIQYWHCKVTIRALLGHSKWATGALQRKNAGRERDTCGSCKVTMKSVHELEGKWDVCTWANQGHDHGNSRLKYRKKQTKNVYCQFCLIMKMIMYSLWFFFSTYTLPCLKFA